MSNKNAKENSAVDLEDMSELDYHCDNIDLAASLIVMGIPINKIVLDTSEASFLFTPQICLAEYVEQYYQHTLNVPIVKLIEQKAILKWCLKKEFGITDPEDSGF